MRSHRFARFVSHLLGRFRLTRRYALSEAEIAHVTRLLTRRSVVFGGIVYAIVMRLLFAAVLLCIANVINDRPLRYDTVLSAHSLSTLVGAFAFVPGFISIGSMVELLNARGVSRVIGFLISLTDRTFTLAVQLAIGFPVLLIRYRTVLAVRRSKRTDPPTTSPGSQATSVERALTTVHTTASPIDETALVSHGDSG